MGGIFMTEMHNNTPREISLKRAEELKSKIGSYLENVENIRTGLKEKDDIRDRQEKIKEIFGVGQSEWDDWHWQVANRITTAEELKKFIPLSKRQVEGIEKVQKKFRWAISPYFLSLINSKDPEDNYTDTTFLQSIPLGIEVEHMEGKPDPMCEEFTNPADTITRRYADRLIINVTNQCGMYCRHCQRRRNIGEFDAPANKKALENGLQYIRDNPEIRDILITGGDPLTLGDDRLDWLLTELDKIEHVEIKRIGTRMPITIPQRVTPELCEMLKKHHPLYLNIQCNHPIELTEDSRKALGMLADSGIQLGNQAVLLKNINDDPHTMKKLNQELLKARVKPYYIFHAKEVIGTSHFRTSIDAGIEIIEQLAGYTSGMARPTYIINAPGGKGKTPMLPEYMISRGREKALMRTWEGEVFEYPNKDSEWSIRDFEYTEEMDGFY